MPGKSKSKSLLFVLFLMLPTINYAQIAWSQRISSIGDADNTEQHAIYQGDIFVCGYFEESITIGGINLISRGESDIFLYRTKPDGTVLWAKSLGGPSYDGDVGLGIDADGNVYLAGGFVEELHLDNSLLLSAMPGNNYWNSFVSKFDENGNLIWVKGILGETNYSEVRVWGNISVSENGFALAASFSGSLSLDGLLIPGSTFEGYLLIASFDLDGNVNWTKIPPGTTQCSKIYLDDAGSFYLTGPFTNSIQFDSYSLTAKVSPYSDVYLAKLDANGNTLWLKGVIKAGSRTDNNWSTSFTVDPTGNIYLVGIFKGDIVLDAYTIHGNTDPEYSITDSFLVKYNANGEVQYGVTFGDSFSAFTTDIVYSPYGVFVLGTAKGPFQFFYSVINNDDPAASAPVYVDGYGFPGQLSVVDETTLYISGFAGTVQGQISKGAWDGVLIKIKPCIAPSPGKPTAINGLSSLCLNEQATYFVDVTEGASQYLWEIPAVFSPNGEIYSNSNEITLNVSSKGNGNISVYALNACNQKGDPVRISVAVSESFVKPIIIKQNCDRELSISKGENIEWYKNDQLLPGFTDKTISILDSGVYKVKINNYCSSVESDAIAVYPASDQAELFFPNVITPNEDKKNDTFCIDKSLFQSNLKIYNRWGKLVYESNAYENSWKGENISSGVYYYYLQNACLTKPYKGYVHVIK